MNQQNKYVKSGYDRLIDDHYPTVDPRCITALQKSWDIPLPALDPFCSQLETGLHPAQVGSLRSAQKFQSIITNPPYKRGVVDMLVRDCLAALNGDTKVVALLMRTQWDHAKSRQDLFLSPFAASIRLLFRPYWMTSRKASPIHSYQWLVWDTRWCGSPIVKHVRDD